MLNLIKLENRIVLDGAAVGEAVDHALDAHESMISGKSFVPSEISGNTDHLAGAAALLASDPADAEPQAEPVEIILVADSLPDYQALVNAANPGTHVIVYDASEDSVAEVLKQVAQRSQELEQPVGSLSILSHGGEGNFRLGNEMITEYNVDENTDAWNALKSVLADDSQIYVFGCSTAGDSGQALLDSLAHATGADVFASDDPTGAGGDWDLEVASKDADDAETPPLNAEQLSDYEGTLLTQAVPTSIETIEDEPGGFDIYLYGSDVDAGTPHDLEHKYDTVDPAAPLQNLNVYYEGWVMDRPKEINGQMVDQYHKWSVEYEPVLNDSGEVTLDFTLNGDAYETTVVIRPINDPPSIETQNYLIPENSEAGFEVGSVQASDVWGPNPEVEGDTLTFKVIGGDGRDLFNVHPDTGQITVAEGANLNYEAKNQYELIVQVQDNGEGELATSGPVTITLTDVNDPPDIDPQNFAIMENSPGGTPVGDIPIQATDPDDGDKLTYTVIGGDGVGVFNVDLNTGEITVAADDTLDYETKDVYELKIQVKDQEGLTDEAIMTIRVMNENEPPEIDPQTFYVDENSPPTTQVVTVINNEDVITPVKADDPDEGDVLTYEIVEGSGNGYGVFNIDPATGQIRVAEGAELDYEDTNTYTLDVQVQDNGDENLTATATMTVIVRDLNDPPVIDDQEFSVYENRPSGWDVGDIFAFDEDGDNLTYTVTGGDGMGVFDVARVPVKVLDENGVWQNRWSSQITVAEGAVLDRETKDIYQLKVRVQDDGDGNLIDDAIMTIKVTDINEPPNVEPQTFNVDENSDAGTEVDPGPVEADDPENDTLTYAVIGGSGEGIFNIDPDSGQISVIADDTLNHEETPSYTLEVQVTDDGPGKLTDQATMTININNLNEPPDIWDQTFEIGSDTPSGNLVGEVQATDPENDDLTFTVINGNENGDFIVGPDGRITVSPTAVFNCDDPITRYTLTVEVQDEQGLADQGKITINVICPARLENIGGTFTEHDDPVKIAEEGYAKGLNTDDTLEWLTVTIDEEAAIRKDDVLDVDDGILAGTNITASYDPAKGVLRLAGADTAENYLEVVRSLTFTSGAENENPNHADRTVNVVFYNGKTLSDVTTGTVQIIAVNDAPVNSVPGPHTTNVDQPVVFNEAYGNRLSINDVDAHHYEADGGWVQDDVVVTLSSEKGGTLTLAAGQRQDGAEVQNNGTTSLTITGTVAEVNAALAEMTYTPATGFEGTETLTMVVNDQGAHGSPGHNDPLTDTDTLTITVGRP
ncbi:MAG: hypothetical protein B6245_13470, partial [Desulfobacteraceae bacterium 4572_88]